MGGWLSDLCDVHMCLLCSCTLHTFGHPQYVQSFNRVFILLFHKIFSYFKGSHGGCQNKGYPYAPYIYMTPVCSVSPYVWTSPICLDAPYIGHPHMFRCPKCIGGIQT